MGWVMPWLVREKYHFEEEKFGKPRNGLQF
jgi:hypothetical protein